MEIRADQPYVIMDTPEYQVVGYTNKDTKERFTAFGVNLSLSCDCVLTGEFVKNKKYGTQFKVSACKEILPNSSKKIKNYLIFAKIKGVGPVIAQRIVDRFRDKTYDAMENPELLCSVRGISRSKAIEICESYKGKKQIREYFDLLNEFDIPSSKVNVVYERFHDIDNVIQTLRSRPYLMCCCKGIDYKKIDNSLINKNMFNAFAADRVRYGILSAVGSNESDGHTFITKENLIDLSMQNLMDQRFILEPDYMRNCIIWMTNQLVRESTLVFKEGVIYRKRMYYAEVFVAKRLVELNQPTHVSISKINQVIQKLESDAGIKLSDLQLEGIRKSLMNSVSIITGGPGCGKTTTLKFLMESLRIIFPNDSIVLFAPTGRAARKMAESTGSDASTIHKGIGIREEETAKVSDLEELDADIIIIDEMSMVGMELMYLLMKCVKQGTKMIFVGDKDQLPSVRAGDVLSELILCGMFATTFLNVNFRQAEGSSIISNGVQINNGNPVLKWDNSSILIKSFKEKDTLNNLLAIVKEMMKNYSLDDIQILTPFRVKSELGAEKLNTHLQEIFNPPLPGKMEISYGERKFRVGDRIIHLKNEDDVFNGDIGFIKEIDVANRTITVCFPCCTVITDEVEQTYIKKQYEASEFKDIDLAYALTIHKSQGSEYPCVIMPFISLFGRMRMKKLFYTAVTRAKETFALIGNEQTIRYALENDSVRRNTFLAYRIVELSNNSKLRQMTLNLEEE